PNWVPIPGRARYKKAIETIDTVLFDIIARRQKTEGEVVDLLTLLIHAKDETTGEGMSDIQLRDEAMTMFLTGYETTAGALSWAFYFLSQNPEKMATLEREINDVLGDRTPTFEDLTKLTYTRMVIQEATRLSPPVWWLARTAKEDDEIDGFHIPAGKTVAPIPYVIHRHPDFWEAPEKFEPERFTKARAANRHKLAWLPFGAGQRQCIGRDVSIMEGQWILARALQMYKITAISGQTTQPRPSATLKSSHGVVLNLEKR
ncbi:MAG: cytochrome P450, partial [Chloroflexota bacterium]